MSKLEKVGSILYVEDEKNIQNELSEFLENFCDNLYIADDGVQGLKTYNKYKPDIVISDIKMPIMDGLEMSKQLKELDEELPIILLTAFSDVEFFQEAIELQVSGYILKPIDLEQLEKKIFKTIEFLELKKELDEKEQMLIQQSKLASMGEMVANIAHQWKQPLAAISMSTNLIKADASMDELNPVVLSGYATDISKQLEYLTKTIDDFTTFFTPRNPKDAFILKEFVDRCVDLVKASFDTNFIETVKEIDDKIESFGDPNQLSQAIINILNNAKDALKEAQEINKKLVFILTAKEDEEHNVIITIKDNAGGIPENIMPKIFEPYFSTKHPSRGTGLGLYITHTIITKNLGGTIEASNEEFSFEGVRYKGAKFTIKIPMKRDS